MIHDQDDFFSNFKMIGFYLFLISMVDMVTNDFPFWVKFLFAEGKKKKAPKHPQLL